MCLYVCTYAATLTWGSESSLKALVLSAYHVGPGGSNSGHQAWWHVLTQAYLLTENFCLLTWCVRAGLLNSITGS